MHEVAIFVVPGTLVLLELFAGAEFLTNAEHAGEDALRRDFQVSSQEGMPVEIIHGSALKAENVVDRGNHKVEVLGPIYERRVFFPLGLLAVPRIYEVSKGLEGSLGILGPVPFWASFASYIKHPEQGCGLVCIGEIRIIEHDEDLEDHAEVRADRVFTAGDGDGSG